MKILLIHLSDIHITGDDNPIIQRASQIADSVKNLEYSLDVCLIVVTGDVAYSGTDEQYLAAYNFFAELNQSLRENLTGVASDSEVPIHLAIAPGNHDCDFSVGGTSRQIVVDSILKNPSRAGDRDIVQTCTAVQRSFFNFLGAVESLKHEPSTPEFCVELTYEYVFDIEGEAVTVRCYNTAWLSQLHESQGHLYFPSQAVGDSEDESILLVAAFHHPYNWLESNAAREFRDKVESMADLVLTGHEHTSSVKTQRHEQGANNICIEGGVLQDSEDEMNSDYNVFVLDTDLERRKYAHFCWNGGVYALTERSSLGSDGGGLAWTNYSVNNARLAGRTRVSDDMRAFLEDPGIDLRHEDRGQLKLQDIFLFPDLVEIEIDSERFGQRMNGEELLDKLNMQATVVVTGDTESGKTSLGKNLFLGMLDREMVPVYLDGTKKPPPEDKVYGYIEDEFVWQYDPSQLEGYRQADRSKRAIIIDDYDKLPLSAQQKKEFLARVSSSAQCVVLLAYDVTSDLAELASPGTMAGGSKDISHYRIQPFGYVARNKLAERWLLLGDNADPGESRFVKQLEDLNRTLNTLVGKNYVPSYPVYVLAVLQAFDSATPIDITASTHGYFYELFIRATLARGRSSKDFDVVASYLAFVAYKMHQRDFKRMSDKEWKIIHRSYEREYDIRRSFDLMKGQLITQEVLVLVNDQWMFKYSYLFNYFVASYMRDHIGESPVRKTLRTMARNLHIESHANILLFLAHLSRAPYVIEHLLAAGRELYPEYLAAELRDDIGFLAPGWSTLPEAVYQEDDPKKNREARLAVMDLHTPPDVGFELVELDEIEPDANDPIVRFVTALRHMEILGQMLKNFPGSLTGPVKVEIARECFHLGLRSLSVVLEMIRDGQTDVLTEMSREIKERHPDLVQWQVDSKAKETLTGLVHMLAFGLIRRIAKAVGSKDLFKTYERLIEESKTPAFELINSSLSLDNKGSFPYSLIRELGSDFKDAPLPLSVLRHLVVEHFHLFPVDFKVKQSISTTIGIRYASLQAVHPRARMLPRGR